MSTSDGQTPLRGQNNTCRFENGDTSLWEYAFDDDLRALLSEDNLLRIHLIKTRHGLAGFAAWRAG